MSKRQVKRYPKKEWCLVVYGQLVRDGRDLPLLFSKAVAEANVAARPGCVMYKVGRDIVLGGK